MSATNRGAVRNARDYYATPEPAFRQVQGFLPYGVNYWEPACGDGRLVRWLLDSGRAADGADLEPQDPMYAKIDFFADFTPREFVITNPPFSVAYPFLQHALDVAPEVMLLLRLNFLGSKSRQGFLQRNPPAALFMITPRPSFTGGGTDACEYAWIYWGHRFQGFHFPATPTVQNGSKP